MPVKVQSLACPKCSAPLPKGDQELICPYCGSRLKVETPAEALDGDELVRRAVKAYQEKKYQPAIADLEQALLLPRMQEKIESTLLVIGLCYDGLGQYDRASEYAERVISINSQNAKAWTNLGIACRKAGDRARARECYERALQIDPNYAELHASLGALYIFDDNAEKAIQSCERAIALDPNLGLGYANLAIAYAMAGRFPDAEAMLRKAILHGYERHADVKDRLEALRSLAV